MSVHKNEHGTWDVRWRNSEGKQPSRTFDTQRQAIRFDARLKGGDINPDDQNVTVGEFYEHEFLRRFRGEYGTLRQYEARWRPQTREPGVQHLSASWGDMPLKDANNPAHVREWHRDMEDDDCSLATMWRAHDLLCTIVKKAVEYEFLDKYRIARIGDEIGYVPERAAPPWLPLTVERIRADILLRVVEPPRGKRGGGVNGAGVERYRWARLRDATIIGWNYMEGTRPGESLALEWPQVLDAAQKDIATHVRITDTIRIEPKDGEAAPRARRRKRTKTRRDRTLELEQATRDDLYLWWKFCGFPTTGPVFPKRYGEDDKFKLGDWSNWRRAIWAPTLERVGVEYQRPYQLRHSAISMWVRQNTPENPGSVSVAARRAGHTTTTCETTYEHEIEMSRHSTFDVTAAIAEARQAVVDEHPALEAFYGVPAVRRRGLSLASGE